MAAFWAIPLVAVLNMDSKFVSSASCAEPEYIVESAWLELAPFAFWLTDALRPKVFVELGTHRGFAYFVFCQALKALGSSSRAYAVDTWVGDAHAGYYGEDVFETVSKHNNIYADFSTLLRCTFNEALSRFDDKTIALLHIDGCHYYEDVAENYASWLPKLVDDAIVLFHDISVHERDFGVWKLFDELKTRHPNFYFEHGHGLGLIAPNRLPQALEPLFNLKAEDADEVRRIYAALGAAISTRRHEEEIDPIRQELNREHRLALDQNANLGRMKSRIQQLLDERAGLLRELDRVYRRPFKPLKYWGLYLLLKALSATSKPFSRRASERFSRSAKRRYPRRFKTSLTASSNPQLQAAGFRWASPEPAPPFVQKQTPQFWFYVGDTVDWLKNHDLLTGVGRVSTELFFGAMTAQQLSGGLAPCVFNHSKSRLEYTPAEDFTALVSQRSDGAIRLPEDAGTGPSRKGPEPGDHVFFTGLVWTPMFEPIFKDLAKRGISFSILIHDIIPVEYPELVSREYAQGFERWLIAAVNSADVLYVSNIFARDQIERWALLNGVQIRADFTVVPFGLRKPEPASRAKGRPADGALSRVKWDRFVLSVGTIDRRKNQKLLCEAWVELARIHPAEKLPQLVLVGRDDIGIETVSASVAELVRQGQILVLSGVADADLGALYGACLVTCFPSLAEGYGLPVAESLAFGKLCITSDLPEIRAHAGDLAWYFPPGDREALVELVSRVIVAPGVLVGAERDIATEFRAPTWRESFEALHRAAVASLASPTAAVAYGRQKESVPCESQTTPSTALRRAANWCNEAAPMVSILIINWNAASLTLECIRHIWAETEGYPYEIIVVDNGSRPDDVSHLRQLAPGIRLIEIGCNRFFGEANNIAAEAAKGDYICLLNNDAFVAPGWLPALMSALKSDESAGAAGPLFLFPDGSVQEAGGYVDEGGYPVRRGRGDAVADPSYLHQSDVDYISAAAFLMSRDLFLKIGGFDLTYEPAYYEDTDLCMKIHAMGRKVLFVPAARVVHIEGASANGDPAAEARRKHLGDLNRGKFVARWGDYLRTRDLDRLAPLQSQFLQETHFKDEPQIVKGEGALPVAVLFTPFALTPGGGERYLLSLAQALAPSHQVILATPCRYSRARLRQLSIELGLDLSRLILRTEQDLHDAPAADLLVAMGNYLVPPIRPLARKNLYHCQFPFPLPDHRAPTPEECSRLTSFDSIVVNSEFTRKNFLDAGRRFKTSCPPVHVLYPPVPQFEGSPDSKKRMILNVGRFLAGGHGKRQDLLIEAFKRVLAAVDQPVELHFAGSSIPSPEHMKYLSNLEAAAQGLPVYFHINSSRRQLETLYSDAAIYWHGTGLGVNLSKHPSNAEHFGISIAEAMSAGAAPFAFNAGGAREIISDGENGFLYDGLDELVASTVALLSPGRQRVLIEIGWKAKRSAKAFSIDAFSKKAKVLI